MFTLVIRSMGGSRRRLEVSAGTTIPTIMAKLEKSLPPWHEIRLFHGERELKDSDDTVKVELSAVAMLSPSKALMELESFEEWRAKNGAGMPDMFEERAAAALTAAQALLDMPEECLTAVQCERLLKLLQGSVQPTGRAKVYATLSAAFGHCCGDFALYIPRLLKALRLRMHVDPFEDGAGYGWELGPLAEIAVRYPGMLVDHSEIITQVAVREIDQSAGIQEQQNLCGAYRLLGQFGDRSHEVLINEEIQFMYRLCWDIFAIDHFEERNGIEWQRRTRSQEWKDNRGEEWQHLAYDHDLWLVEDYAGKKKIICEYCGEEFYKMLLSEAKTALKLIRARWQFQDTTGAEDNTDVEEAAEVQGQAEVVESKVAPKGAGGQQQDATGAGDEEVEEATETHLQEESVESEVALEELAEAGRRSVEEALLLEQADVIEAVLRSKVDAQSAGKVALAKLTFHSPDVFKHLLASKELKDCIMRVEDAGCQLRPPWANGALLLIPMNERQLAEVGLILRPHNIMLFESECKWVDSALKRLPRRRRPALSLVPPVDEEDWSCAATDAGDSGMEMQFIIVQRTFVNFPESKLDVSEASVLVHSSPAECGEPAERGDVMRQNPRMWR